MRLVLIRDHKTSAGTLGTLAVVPLCQTLEDPDRELEAHPEQKIAGASAIPRGIYRVTLDWSPRHGKVMPHILDVPGFAGIRFDVANVPEEVKGCVAVGERRDPSGAVKVLQSGLAYNLLFKILEAAKTRGELVEIEIR